MNVEPLDDADIARADVVMTSTTGPSLRQVLRRCRRLDVPVIAGEPHPSGSPRQLAGPSKSGPGSSPARTV